MTTVIAPEEHALDLLREEYDSLPGMRLTLPQTARLLSVNRKRAAQVLKQLEGEGVLVEDPAGVYRRRAPLLA
jgi:hypothetical protein